MKISEKVREAAIEALLLCADDQIIGTNTRTCDVSTWKVDSVASDAWVAAWANTGDCSNADIYLEAAALLRDGWCPGDPVHRIKRGAK